MSVNPYAKDVKPGAAMTRVIRAREALDVAERRVDALTSTTDHSVSAEGACDTCWATSVIVAALDRDRGTLARHWEAHDESLRPLGVCGRCGDDYPCDDARPVLDEWDSEGVE